ncbi:MAG: cell division protein FtsZ [Solirubrobacterales bacterium]
MDFEGFQDYPVSIKVIGVGGGGNNAINRMAASSIKGVELISVNTDLKSLNGTNGDKKLQIGVKLTKGLGSGSNPDIGEMAALENEKEIKDLLKGADMVFVTAGMGGGTGTGAAPIVASIAKKMGILTIGIVTKPFPFEGKRRMDNAIKGIEKLRQNVDSLIVILNGNLLDANNKKISFLEAFNIVDEVLRVGISGITGIINNPGLINVDFNDICTIMKDSGIAHMGIGVASGEDRAVKAADQAMNSPLLETSLNGATGLLVNVSGSSNISLLEINDAVNHIEKHVHSDAEIIFGTTIDETLKDEICITLIATGLQDTGIQAPSSQISKEQEQEYEIDIPAWLRQKNRSR